MVFYNAHRKPDPNGEYELRDGKLVLRDGKAVTFSVLLADSGQLQITDAERGAIVARARMIHRDRHAWMGDLAPEFTQEDEVRALNDSHPASGMVDAAQLSALADAAGERAAAARARMIADLSSTGRH